MRAWEDAGLEEERGSQSTEETKDALRLRKSGRKKHIMPLSMQQFKAPMTFVQLIRVM